MDAKTELQKLTNVLLDKNATYAAIRSAVYDLKDLFAGATGFEEENNNNQHHIKMVSGVAVSPFAAAYCIIDMMRTACFLRGVCQAVNDRLYMNPGEPVKVLYAGSGPFATLLTPLTTVFSTGQLQMVLLEINPHSIEYLQKTIQHFEMEKYVLGMEQADAVDYCIPEKYQPDILLSETMKAALYKEPQVNIIANLLPQCTKSPLLIPASIKIDFCRLGKWENYQHAIHPLTTLLAFNKETALRIAFGKNGPAVFGEGLPVMVAPDSNGDTEETRYALTTFIQVYGNHTLDTRASDLTLLHQLKEKPGSINETWVFRYNRKEIPGFYIERKAVVKK